MGCEYCDYCDKIVDLDYDVEHWDEEEYLKGRDEWKCTVELKDDNWNAQAHYGDAVNKANKENPPVHVDQKTGRDIY